MGGLSSKSLRQQAKTFQDAAEKLIAAAEVLESMESHTPLNGSSHDRVQPQRERVRLKVRMGRLEELKHFVGQNGPVTFKEVVDKSGIPEGTVAAYLKEKKGFSKDSEGKWSVKSEK